MRAEAANSLFELLRRRDAELADAFDNPRRSGALLQLACIKSHGLLREEEYARFGAETRAAVQKILSI